MVWVPKWKETTIKLASWTNKLIDYPRIQYKNQEMESMEEKF